MMENKTTAKRKKIYPGTLEAEKQKSKATYSPEGPDFIGNAPNYDKFKGWSVEKVLSWLNID